MNVELSESHLDEQSDQSEQESEQLSDDESFVSDIGHPFPTPPPDATIATTTDMATSKKDNKTLLGWAVSAIEVLGSRSGSSVRAIMKHMISAGYEMTDKGRLSKLLYRQLKRAAAKGLVRQVKFSFKLPVEITKPKSIEKMKENGVKKKLAKNQKTEQPTEQTERAIGKVKKQSTVPKTTKTAKKKKMADLTAGAEIVKEKPTKQASKLKAMEKKGDLAAEELKKTKKTKFEKAKPPRVSIGTLAHPSGKPKIQVKAIKKLTAGRAGHKNTEDTDSEMDSHPNSTSTPVASAQKGKVRLRK